MIAPGHQTLASLEEILKRLLDEKERQPVVQFRERPSREIRAMLSELGIKWAKNPLVPEGMALVGQPRSR